MSEPDPPASAAAAAPKAKPKRPPRKVAGFAPARVPKGFPGRVEFLKSAAKLEQAPHTAWPEVCFCGRSNVGKSSLINVLANRRQLARVSSTPGRTRLINFFEVQDTVCLVDLPGYGFAKGSRAEQAAWGVTIRDYLEDRPQLGLAVLLVDIRRTPGDDERDLLAWFSERDRRCLLVATKADKVPTTRRKAALARIANALAVPPSDVVPFSAPSRLGRDTIWGTILAYATANETNEAERGDSDAP